MLRIAITLAAACAVVLAVLMLLTHRRAPALSEGAKTPAVQATLAPAPSIAPSPPAQTTAEAPPPAPPLPQQGEDQMADDAAAVGMPGDEPPAPAADGSPGAPAN